MRYHASPLRGKDRIELPIALDGEQSTLSAWKSHDEDGDCITVGLVEEGCVYEIASIGTSSNLDSDAEVLISALPGNLGVSGPHILTSFCPKTRYVTVDAMLYDEQGRRKDVSTEGTVKMGPDVYASLSPQDVGPDLDGFIKMLFSTLQTCSGAAPEWLDDDLIEVIHGKGRTYLADGDRLIDVTGNSILYVCKQVVDLLVEKSVSQEPEQSPQRYEPLTIGWHLSGKE